MKYKKQKAVITKLALTLISLAGCIITAQAQFNIKIPKIPKPSPPVKEVKTDKVNDNGSVSNPQTKSANLPGYPDTSLDGPVIDATSIRFSPRTIPNSYPNGGNEKNYDLWSWTPRIDFIVRGRLENGTVISFDFTLPNGTAWVSQDCPGGEIEKNGGLALSCGNNIDEKKGIIQTGVFGFDIKLSNELQGKSVVLYSGKVKIDKWVLNPSNNPKAMKNFVYHVVSDWKLPMSYLYVPKTDSYDDHGPLVVQFWFRGSSQTVANTTGYLFYQGKEVASTLSGGGADRVTEPYSELASRDSENEFYAKDFWFDALVFDKNRNPNTQNQGFPLYKNPGEYEVKVLQNGKLARVAKFTVDAGGNIVNNGLSVNNKLGTTRYLIPAQVIGEQDGKWNKNAWQTEAFYGNQLTGFVIP